MICESPRQPQRVDDLGRGGQARRSGPAGLELAPAPRDGPRHARWADHPPRRRGGCRVDGRDERGVLRLDAQDDAGHHRRRSAGRYRDNPLWWTKRVVTVHPLGGAPMGRHVHEGVVDSWNESFGHPGLFVVDGSPCRVRSAPTPRSRSRRSRTAPSNMLLEKPRRARRTVPRAVPAPTPEVIVAEPEAGRGMEFTEKMKGYFALDETDPMAGWTLGRQLSQRFMFTATITAPDVERFVARRAITPRSPRATSNAICSAVSCRWSRAGRTSSSQAGDEDPMEMRYRLWFTTCPGCR